MAVRDFVRVLQRERLLFICTFLLVVGVGAAFALTRTDTYSATAKLLVNTSSYDSATAETTARTFAELLRTSSPAFEAANAAAGNGTAADLTVAVAPGTHLVEATATHSSPESAREIADAYVDAFLTEWRDTVQRSGEERLSTISSQIAATTASSPSDGSDVQRQSLEDRYKDAQKSISARLASIELAQHASAPTVTDGPSVVAVGALTAVFALLCGVLVALGRNALRD